MSGDEMEKGTKHYMEYLNHNLNWLKMITIEIDKLPIHREYINFFMQMFMQWIKDGSSTSSFRTLIIPRLPRFEKLSLSQLQLYIETQTTTQCFMCCKYQNIILNRSSEGKENVFIILNMLKIHTSFRKLNKTYVYDLHLKKEFI